MNVAWRRAAGAAVAGILLALPPGVWAGDRGGPPGGGPPAGGGPNRPGNPGGHPHENDHEDFDRIRNHLESHPRFKKVWEKLSEDQRRRCLDRIMEKLRKRGKDLYSEMGGFAGNARYKRMRELKEKLRKRVKEREVKDVDAWLAKRRKDAEARHEKPHEDRRGP